MNTKPKKNRKFAGIGLQSLAIYATGEPVELYTYGYPVSVLKKIFYRVDMKNNVLNMKMANLNRILFLSDLPIIYSKPFSSKQLDEYVDEYFPLFYATTPLTEEQMALLNEQVAHYISNLNNQHVPFEESMVFKKLEGVFQVEQEQNGTAKFSFDFVNQHPFAPNAYTFFYAILGQKMHQLTIQLDDKNQTEITLSYVYGGDKVVWVSEQMFESSYKNEEMENPVKHYWSYEVQAKIVTHPFTANPQLIFNTSIKRWSPTTYKHIKANRYKADKTSVYVQINRDLFPQDVGGHIVLNLPKIHGQWDEELQILLQGLDLPRLPEPREFQNNLMKYSANQDLIMKVVYDQTSSGANHLVKSGAGWSDRYIPFKAINEQFEINPIQGFKFMPVATLEPVKTSQIKNNTMIYENIVIQCYYLDETTFFKIQTQLAQILNVLPTQLNDEFVYEVNHYQIILQGVNLSHYFEGEFLKFEDKAAYKSFENKLSQVMRRNSNTTSVLFELPGKEQFAPPLIDPKMHLRKFFYQHNKLSQFVEPAKPNEGDVHENRLEKSLLDILNKHNILFKDFDDHTYKVTRSKHRIHLIGATIIDNKIVYIRIYHNQKWIFVQGYSKGWMKLTDGWVNIVNNWESIESGFVSIDHVIEMLYSLEKSYPEDQIVFTFIRSNWKTNYNNAFKDFATNSKLQEKIYPQLERTYFVQLRNNDEVGEYFGVLKETLEEVPNGICAGVFQMGQHNFASIAGKSTPMKKLAELSFSSKMDNMGKAIAKPSMLFMTPFGWNSQLHNNDLASIIHKSRSLNVSSSKSRKKNEAFVMENDATTKFPYPIHLLEGLKNTLYELGKIK